MSPSTPTATPPAPTWSTRAVTLLLDLAAKRSVLEKWQFDVSHCAHTFPATHQVAVEYRNEEYQ